MGGDLGGDLVVAGQQLGDGVVDVGGVDLGLRCGCGCGDGVGLRGWGDGEVFADGVAVGFGEADGVDDGAFGVFDGGGAEVGDAGGFAQSVGPAGDLVEVGDAGGFGCFRGDAGPLGAGGVVDLLADGVEGVFPGLGLVRRAVAASLRWV